MWFEIRWAIQDFLFKYLCPYYYEQYHKQDDEHQTLQQRIGELEADVDGAIQAVQYWQQLATKRLAEIHELKLQKIKKKKTTKKGAKK